VLLEGRSPAGFFQSYGDRIGEIHLHGIDREQADLDGRLADHRQLRRGETWLLELLPLLARYGGVINIETFSWAEAQASIEVLAKRNGEEIYIH